MIAAVMQPYFFPYIGYFQLMSAVDVFVVYDDAQYMKGGWINRNRICRRGSVSWMTMPVSHASVSAAINQRFYLLDSGVPRIDRQLRAAYSEAPYGGEVLDSVCSLLGSENNRVATYNAGVLNGINTLLGISPEVVFSSEVPVDNALTGQARVVALCRALGVSRYINPIGGRALYDRDEFDSAGIELVFLRTTSVPRTGQEHLSIVDLLCHHGIAAVTEELAKHEVLEG
jgi:hypothetical protein